MSDIIEYNSLGSGVKAFTTLRTIGRDRNRLCQMLYIDDAHLIIPHQTHGKRIYKVDDRLLMMDESDRKEALEGIDAVVTDVTGVCIGVSTADCIPVLLYDEKHHAVAAVHAGWKGTVVRIVQDTIRTMMSEYDTDPKDLKAVIGPGISLKNFEVGDEVYDRFNAEGFDIETIARRYDKYHLDLWECNRQQLMEMGVEDDNIHIERICTYDNTDKLFSARKEQKGDVKCGRNFNAIILNNL